MKKGIYNICPYIFYQNDQLMKDTCLIPYAFYKEFGYEPVIVTAKKEEYTYLKYLEGLVMDIQPTPNCLDEWIEACKQYILDNYEKIDILFCFGSYSTYTHIVPLYKSVKPEGKVILKLDANSLWMDRIPYENDEYKLFYENCNLITCESRALKKFLSRKWPYKIEYVVNGFMGKPDRGFVPYEEKENIILTVGRLGTKQKANHVLLEAFAKSANQIPGWKLRLVGSITPEFMVYIENFLKQNPNIAHRVTFTGNISDKGILEQEYRKAKIFAITSLQEGGTPNVFSEAALNGCYMVCSNIDAVQEVTNWGRLGKAFQMNNIEELAKILETVCSVEYNDEMKKSCNEIQKYIYTYFDYKIIVRKLMHLLSMEEG